MTDDEINTLKIELATERDHHVKLNATIDDLRRKVDVHLKASDVQKRHHALYKDKFNDQSQKAKQARAGLASIATALSGEILDVPSALEQLKAIDALLKPIPTPNG